MAEQYNSNPVTINIYNSSAVSHLYFNGSEVTIATKTLSSIAITTAPTKTSYYEGDTLDLTGIAVTATYSDSTTANATTSCTFSPANGATLSTAGTQTITATYTEGGVTETATTTVMVAEKPYVTFAGDNAFTITTQNSFKNWDGTLEYSTDAETWTEWSGTTAISSAVVGGKSVIYMRGSGNTKITGGGTHKFIFSGDVTFEGNYLYLLNYSNTENVTTLTNSAFQSCPWLTDVEITSSFETIGNLAFSGVGITSIVIPSGVTYGINLFMACSLLETAVFDAGTTELPLGILRNCTALSVIKCYATTPPTISQYALANVPADCAIYVPAASVAAYKAASGWSDWADYIQAIV